MELDYYEAIETYSRIEGSKRPIKSHGHQANENFSMYRIPVQCGPKARYYTRANSHGGGTDGVPGFFFENNTLETSGKDVKIHSTLVEKM